MIPSLTTFFRHPENGKQGEHDKVNDDDDDGDNPSKEADDNINPVDA